MPTFRESIAAGGMVIGPDRKDPIEIVEYDPEWPARFAAMRARLIRALGPFALRVDHVGSTAVPDLVAKPVIDVQVSVPDVEDEDSFRDAIESLGFRLRFIERGHRYFQPPPGTPRDYQVHLCTIGSDWERRHLLFRDYLRANPMVAHEYGALKMRLASKHRNDRIEYNDEKGPFIEAVARAAEDWATETDWQP